MLAVFGMNLAKLLAKKQQLLDATVPVSNNTLPRREQLRIVEEGITFHQAKLTELQEAR